VTPTKIVLIVLLLASAISNAFANAPGSSYIQCDPQECALAASVHDGRVVISWAKCRCIQLLAAAIGRFHSHNAAVR